MTEQQDQPTDDQLERALQAISEALEEGVDEEELVTRVAQFLSGNHELDAQILRYFRRMVLLHQSGRSSLENPAEDSQDESL